MTSVSNPSSPSDNVGVSPPSSPRPSTPILRTITPTSSATPPSGNTSLADRRSFCIDSLLNKSDTPTPGEPLPFPLSSSAAAAASATPIPTISRPIVAPPGLFPPFYPYQGLPPSGVAPPGGVPAGSPPLPSSLESLLKSGNQAAMNVQSMQLEWLARTGMLYHRFPELAGTWMVSFARVICMLFLVNGRMV